MNTSRRNNSEGQRCILGLQDLKLSHTVDGTEQAHSAAVSTKSNSIGKPRAVGAIESFVLDNSTQNNRPDYSFYERSNVIASSKFATPKRVETIASINKRDTNSTALPASPTRSIDSLSQRSISYQTEDLYEIPANPPQFVPPVYENVDYYEEHQSPQPYYHHMYQHTPPPPPVCEGYYNTRYSKAQPQVPVNSKVAHPIVYENMLCQDKENRTELKNISNNEQHYLQQGSKPGPQVPNTNTVSRVTGEISVSNKLKDKPPPPPPYSIVQDIPGSDYTVMKSAPPKYTDVALLTSKESSISSNRDNKTVTIPSTAIYASIAPSAQRPKANIATEVQTSLSSPKFYHNKPILVHGKDSAKNGTYNIKPNTGKMQIIEDANSSDYVCMTGGNTTSTTVSNNKDIMSMPSESITSRNMVGGLSSLCSPSQSPAPSPTPSSVSQVSAGSRGSGGRGKSLLPYSITPPRPAGPSEAQRKIEELTKQLEEEMEKQDEEGEYFG